MRMFSSRRSASSLMTSLFTKLASDDDCDFSIETARVILNYIDRKAILVCDKRRTSVGPEITTCFEVLLFSSSESSSL